MFYIFFILQQVDPNNSVVWLFLGGKKTSSPPCLSLCVSLAGGGRERVFGCMVCEDQFEDWVADYIRGKMLERGSWQGVKWVDVHCVLRMGGVPLPCLAFSVACVWKCDWLSSCFSRLTLFYLANICMCSCHRYERRGWVLELVFFLVVRLVCHA